MSNFFLFWKELDFLFSENFFHTALLLNILVTLFLIIQNILYRRNFNASNNSERSKDNTEPAGLIPKFSEEGLSEASKKLLTNTGRSILDRAIKMIQDGSSQKDIMNCLDIEPDYLSILVKNYKGNRS